MCLSVIDFETCTIVINAVYSNSENKAVAMIRGGIVAKFNVEEYLGDFVITSIDVLYNNQTPKKYGLDKMLSKL